MGDSKGKLTSGNICCFGVSNVGVPLATVIAHMCPSLNVVVLDLNAEKIVLWNTKQISSREPKLEEMLKKTQNRNLMFSSNTVGGVKAADIIFISMVSQPLEVPGDRKLLDLADVEEAARIIARESESNKIIAVMSTVPVGTIEALQRILNANKVGNVTFQVLSIPEFFVTGNAVSSLLHPDKLLIGSDLSREALDATEILASIFTSWVPRNRIITMDSKSTELAKLTETAFLAQSITSVSAFSIVCENSGADMSDVIKIIGNNSDMGVEHLELSLGFGRSQLYKNLQHLVNMCEELNLLEAAEYWNQVLLMNTYHEQRFYKKILSSFYNTLRNTKIAIWGLTYNRTMEITNDSLAIDMCVSLLEEGAKLNVCDPKVECRQFLGELKAAGITDSKLVTFTDDPYKAARKSNAIIIITDWNELKSIDYGSLYKEMLRPAYIFDGRKCLPHDELKKIGFIVETIGKAF